VSGVTRLARFRHYVNLGAMSGRLDRLLQDFRWDRMDRVFAGCWQAGCRQAGG
jgi:hypothetical protein